MMNDTNFQVIAPDPHVHREAIYELLEHEWESIGAFGFARVHSDSHPDWLASHIGLLNGEIVTHYSVYDITMRIGISQVRAAGINVDGDWLLPILFPAQEPQMSNDDL